MSDLWRVARQASERFAAQALDYDRFRPRYPESVFDDIMELANLVAGAEAIEVGAGTGIATEPLVDRGLVVTAIEPAAEMAGVAETKIGDRAQIFVGRFEDYLPQRSVELIASFNAWHWIEPSVAVDRAAPPEACQEAPFRLATTGLTPATYRIRHHGGSNSDFGQNGESATRRHQTFVQRSP
jgi:SAM-dependent methyltransferase